MSTIINATTTNGVVIQPDNSGSLVLQTNNGTTALTISTAQNTTLAGKLTTASSGIQFSDASTQTAAASPYVLKNRIINGDMRIDQRNAGASVTPTTTAAANYTLDRWAAWFNVASKFSVQQNAASVTPPTGFINYLGITSLAATTVGASDYYFLSQQIEGLNTYDLDWGKATAKTVTLSFWVRSSLTGTFGGSLRNGSADRSYPFSYTISTANTWTQISVTITGDTSGTWLTTNGTGINVSFSLGMGTTYSTTAGAWAAGNYASATGATSVVGTNGATWYVTGVQLEQNTTATPFERRLYNQELAACQRYYWKAINGIYQAMPMAFNFNSTLMSSFWQFPVTMRSVANLEVSTGTDYYYFARNNVYDYFNSFTINGASTTGAELYNNTQISGTAGDAGNMTSYNAASSVAFSAEL